MNILKRLRYYFWKMIYTCCLTRRSKKIYLSEYLNTKYLNEFLLRIIDDDYFKCIVYYILRIKFEEDLSFTVYCDRRLSIADANYLLEIIRYSIRPMFEIFFRIWGINRFDVMYNATSIPYFCEYDTQNDEYIYNFIFIQTL